MSASNEDKSITYQYDANGLRYKKTVDGVEYTYYYMGDKLVRLTIGDTTIMDFTYDQNGQPYAMIYNGTKLYYVLNQQGDVVRLVNSSGKSYGVYRYDAWGNILYVSDNQYTNSNPLRYRGYVYDTETQLYYCQSRYYDPAIGRFINADDVDLLGADGTPFGYNLFAYCSNNPSNCIDESGEFATWVAAAVGGAFAGGIIGAVSSIVSSGLSGEKISIAEVGKAAFLGAVNGAIGAFGGATGRVVATSVAVGIISAVNTNGPLEDKVIAGLIAGVGTFLGGKYISTITASGFEAGITAFAGTLFAGVQTEIVNVTVQQIKTPSLNSDNIIKKSFSEKVFRAKSVYEKRLLC